MPLYFLRTERGTTPVIEDGIEFPSLSAARQAIAQTAAMQLCDQVGNGTAEVAIFVTDAKGQELFAAVATVAISPLP